jgi:colanic acid biosynthesis glycosyl transferase WcaI
LDRYMQQRIANKGVSPHKMTVVPPWSLDNFVQVDVEGRQRFRRANAIGDKFVVMHSGNHSPCHPLTPMLEAAKALRDRDDIVFYFVGGGSEWARVIEFRTENKLSNICVLPYQPLEELSASLSAADLHIVVMGKQYVGIVHPCKIYNILAIGARFLYIGPREGHIPDLATDSEVQNLASCAEAADADGIVNIILAAVSERVPPAKRALPERFSRENLLRKMRELIEAEPTDDMGLARSPQNSDSS